MLRPAETNDLQKMTALLTEFGLPTQGVAESLGTFVVQESDGLVVGVGGLELHGTQALLRSLAVAPSHRGQGLATSICDHLEAQAAAHGATSVFVLTETAEEFFAHRRYVTIERKQASPEIAASEEFASLCSPAATLMRLCLAEAAADRTQSASS